jgi:MFS transporter, ACDE family, multidrug resistance protein
VNPLAYLGRFFRQPRLIAGWLFAVIRSCGWWVYVVYVPIFCIESGLGDKLGGTMLSVSNATLLLSPFMASWVRRRSVRVAMRLALAYCAVLFCLATATASVPYLTVALLFLASFGLVMLDVAGGLPFMMAVKPSERPEMAAVYSSFRDVSGIATPGMAWLVLWVAPLNFIFAASGLAFAAAFAIAGQLHPRLGILRPSRARA